MVQGLDLMTKLETPDGDKDPSDADFEDDPDTPDDDDGTWEFDFPATNPLHGNGFIHIHIIPPTPEDPDGEIIFPIYIDPSGLVHTTEGDTWPVPQYTAWLDESGFQDVRTLPVPGAEALLLATRR